MAQSDGENYKDGQEVLGTLVNNSSPSELSAASAANQVDELFDAQDETKAEDFLWGFFTKLLQLASKLPPEDPKHAFLINLLQNLGTKPKKNVQVWGNSCALWADLPLFGSCMREAFNLTPRFDGSDKDETVVSAWISLNSFCARVLGAGLYDANNFALWVLRSALEEGKKVGQDSDAAALVAVLKRDTDISVAHGWIAHAGKKLWEIVQAKAELNEQERRMLAPGDIYAEWSPDKGEPGFNKERWGFWKQRLTELGQAAGGSAKAKAERTAALMEELEG